MHIKSTFSSNTAKPADIPVSILALVRTRTHSDILAEPRTAAIVGRTFVRLPDTFPALVTLARTTFHLPPHAALQITTDMLDVCRGDPVGITEDVYGLLRGVLDYLRVEVVEDGNKDRSKGQREGGNGRLGLGNDEKEPWEERQSLEELGFVDVFSASGVQQSKQPPPNVVSHGGGPSQGTHVLQTKPKTRNPRASPSTAAAPASSNGSPAPLLPLQSPLPVTPSAVGPPDDPTNFVIYISGPNSTHGTAFVTCSTRRVSEVLHAARLHFGVSDYCTP
ncbi:hypothetical protein BD779DRAFT_1673406 [Infundibulicybe gibba]|nr:hypothetical protein BD779DRAFT_1673406 [Infundibulicybe gibba]